MENELRFFYFDFAKMVADKERQLPNWENTQLALCDQKQDLKKEKMSSKSSTSIHQVVKAKVDKERDQMMQERDKLMEEKDNLVLYGDELKQEKNELNYMIGDLSQCKEDTNDEIWKIKEILDGFE